MKVTTAIVWIIFILSYFGLKAYKHNAATRGQGIDPIAQRIEALPWFSDNKSQIAAVALACEARVHFVRYTNAVSHGVTSTPVVDGVFTGSEFSAETRW